LYHRDEEPQTFEAGEWIPDGWEHTPDIFACRDMTKDELVEWAEARGVTGLDRRKSEENLIEEIFEVLG
jgi:hypothetical protein